MLDVTEAWQGAASVWTHTENIGQHREPCLAGIEAGLKADGHHGAAVARHMENIFQDSEPPVLIPIDLIRRCLGVFENDSESEDKHRRLSGFGEWLGAISQRDPELALAAAEIYLAYVKRAKPFFYDYENRLVQLITRLFAEAEEREESDYGAMLERVVAVQDSLLSLGVNSIDDWLKAAERQ
uniref:Uncharacterized protein n=1 Tax=Candidatus Kentrum sp. FW TaxID=2126338 RepID=A0A450U018_9GAMM|nr:MAG: hypothetical protein BECKFW1821C_GA0114237_10818 [Candidatus Kentron sp. FW]